jgi:hypothetical protein
MPLPKELTSEINRILSALRAGLDAGSYPAHLAQHRAEDIRLVYLRFEEVRFAYRAHTSRPLPGFYTQEEAIAELRRGLIDLSDDPLFVELTSSVRFRPLNMTRPSMGFALHPGLMEPRLSVREAMSYFLDGLAALPVQLNLLPEESIQGLSELRHIIPQEQNVAPVRFRIENNRVVLAPRPAVADFEDVPNVRSAKKELASQAERIIQELRRSNCDKRLLESVEYLKDGLESDTDIIRLGLSNIACDAMRQQFETELPNAVSAMLLAQTTGAGLYVAQFPEWHRFTE